MQQRKRKEGRDNQGKKIQLFQLLKQGTEIGLVPKVLTEKVGFQKVGGITPLFQERAPGIGSIKGEKSWLKEQEISEAPEGSS